jgi:16S rRNA (adenine1518-N6/adenine1519-N6)-dimethyltransferase
MLEPLPVPSMLKDYGLKPQKGLGQNFLVDDLYLEKIVQAGGLQKTDTILEIGAGLGSLTRYLAASAGEVVAVEIDKNLLPALKKVSKPFDNVRLVLGDFMEMDITDLVTVDGYKVVANIPYYLTSNLIRRLMESHVKPELTVLTVQKEVAQRICAGPGKMSLLALGVQVYGEPRIAFTIPKGAFFPVPQVDSATLVVEHFSQPRILPERLDNFFLLAKAGFTQKRKMLHNAMAGAPDINHEQALDMLSKAGIEPERRAQTLNLQEWDALTTLYSKYRSKD